MCKLGKLGKLGKQTRQTRAGSPRQASGSFAGALKIFGAGWGIFWEML